MGCQYLLPPGVLYHSLGERHGLNNCDSCRIYYFLKVHKLKLDLVVKKLNGGARPSGAVINFDLAVGTVLLSPKWDLGLFYYLDLRRT